MSTKEGEPVKRVLFVCGHNAGRSVRARARVRWRRARLRTRASSGATIVKRKGADG